MGYFGFLKAVVHNLCGKLKSRYGKSLIKIIPVGKKQENISIFRPSTSFLIRRFLPIRIAPIVYIKEIVPTKNYEWFINYNEIIYGRSILFDTPESVFKKTSCKILYVIKPKFNSNKIPSSVDEEYFSFLKNSMQKYIALKNTKNWMLALGFIFFLRRYEFIIALLCVFMYILFPIVYFKYVAISILFYLFIYTLFLPNKIINLAQNNIEPKLSIIYHLPSSYLKDVFKTTDNILKHIDSLHKATCITLTLLTALLGALALATNEQIVRNIYYFLYNGSSFAWYKPEFYHFFSHT